MDTKSISNRRWLLLPGTLCSGEVFRGFLDALGVPEEHRLVLDLEHPTVDDYREVLSEVTSDMVVCGFSLGAIVAAHQAHFIRAHSLILFGLNPYPDNPNKWEERMLLRDDVQRFGGAAAISQRKPHLYGPGADGAREKIEKMADRTAHLIDAQTKLALTRPGAMLALENAQSRIFCLTGSYDTQAPPDLGSAAAGQARMGQFSQLEGLGHFALLENPEACAKAVRKLHTKRYEYT